MREAAVITGMPRASRSMVASDASPGRLASPSICGRLWRMAHQPSPSASAAKPATTNKVHRSQRSKRLIRNSSVFRNAQDGQRVGAAGDAGELAFGDDDEFAFLDELELQHHREDGLEELRGAHFR